MTLGAARALKGQMSVSVSSQQGCCFASLLLLMHPVQIKDKGALCIPTGMPAQWGGGLIFAAHLVAYLAPTELNASCLPRFVRRGEGNRQRDRKEGRG